MQKLARAACTRPCPLQGTTAGAPINSAPDKPVRCVALAEACLAQQKAARLARRRCQERDLLPCPADEIFLCQTPFAALHAGATELQRALAQLSTRMLATLAPQSALTEPAALWVLDRPPCQVPCRRSAAWPPPAQGTPRSLRWKPERRSAAGRRSISMQRATARGHCLAAALSGLCARSRHLGLRLLRAAR